MESRGDPLQDVYPTEAQNQEAEGNTKSSQYVPPPTVVVPVGPQGPHTPVNDTDPRARRTERRDRWRLFIEATALVVGFLGFVALIYTLRETGRQANIADKTYRATQRASVSLGLSDGKFVDFVTLGGQLYVVLYFRNYGGTTARSTKIDIQSAITTPTSVGAVVVFSPVPKKGYFPMEVGPDIPPNFQHAEYLIPSANFQEVIGAGQAIVTLVGRLSYVDEFGSYCHTFSLYYKPEVPTFRLRGARDGLCDGNAHTILFCHNGWDAEITDKQGAECTEEGIRPKVK
jgi:hypothetical protein